MPAKGAKQSGKSKASSRSKRSTPVIGTTLVRMYRQGLGDCFLIRFYGDDRRPVNVLIDCGVWDADTETLKQMDKVVQDIVKVTDGHLDLLIVTHEHWDHNSGFLQCAKAFQKMTIDRIWLAWTENKRDPLARTLRTEFDERRKQLAPALQRMAAVNPEFADRVAAVTNLDFLGVGAAGGGNAATPKATKGVKADPAAAMEWVRGGAGGRVPVDYLKPGQVLSVPRASNAARAFVLGPPRSRQLLGKNRPTKKQEREGEVYHEHDSFHLGMANRLADTAFLAAVAQHGKTSAELDQLVGEEREEYELGLPFDVAHQLTVQQAAQLSSRISPTYFSQGDDWRRIDSEWLNTAAQIAIWMDSSTNNTSLVLAFELLPQRKVLLFVADAQVGSWISWPDVKFDGAHADVTVGNLLDRTVLYKVGHHGSHNATLRRDGLEKMGSRELVAMIPVNRKSVEKKSWKMPFPPMYRALRKVTDGRVIRSDEGVMEKLASTAPAAWKQFTSAVHADPVYLEYTVRHD